MTHTHWDAAAPGPAPSYHPDPTVGGAPVVSPDGHWWWDGSHWVLLDDPEPEDEGEPPLD